MPDTSSANRHRRALQLLRRGAALLQSGEAQAALSPLERAHALEPDNVAVAINLAGAYILLNRHSEALPLLESARRQEPHNPMLWINLGAAYLGNPMVATPERQARAIEAFERALELDPAAPSVHYNLGLIYLDRGERQHAVDAFRRALAANPLDRDAATFLQKLTAQDPLSSDSALPGPDVDQGP